MPNLPIQVYIVDDEPSVCAAYARMVRSAKMQPRTFGSVEAFMHVDLSGENACVISDVRMPGTSGDQALLDAVAWALNKRPNNQRP